MLQLCSFLSDFVFKGSKIHEQAKKSIGIKSYSTRKLTNKRRILGVNRKYICMVFHVQHTPFYSGSRNTVKGALNGLRRLEWDPEATFGHLAAHFRIRTVSSINVISIYIFQPREQKHAEEVLRINHDLVLKASAERLETIEKNSSEREFLSLGALGL